MVVIVFVLILTGVAFIILSMDILKEEFKTVKKKRQVSKDVKEIGGMKKKYFYLIELIRNKYKDSRIVKETDTSIVIHIDGINESETFYITQSIDSKLVIKYVRKNETREFTLTRTFYDSLEPRRMMNIIEEDLADKSEEKVVDRRDLPF